MARSFPQNLTNDKTVDSSFPNGGGEAGELVRLFDWTKTSIGHINDWPQSLRTAVDIVLHSPVPLVILWGKDGIMIYNDAYSKFAGGRHPELLGSKVLEGWPEVADFNQNVLDTCLEGKTLSYKDLPLVLHRNNEPEEVTLDLNYSPVKDESGKSAGVLAIVVETTERVHAKEDMEKFMFMVENANDAFILMRQDGTFEYLNDFALKRWGYTREEVRSLRVPDVDPIYQERQFRNIFALAQIKKIPTFETKHKRKDGTTFPVEVSINGITLEGQPYMLAIARDITKRKKTEDEFAKTQQQLNEALSVGLIGAWTLDIETNLVIASDSLAHMFGVDPKKAAAGLGLDVFYKSMHPDDHDYVKKNIDEAIRTGNEFDIDYRVIGADNKERWVLCRGQNEKFNDASPRRFTGVLIDITERKKAEETLEENKADLQLLADSMPQQVWSATPDGSLDYVNRQVLDYFQKPSSKILNNGWKNELHPNDLQRTTEVWKKSLRTGKPYEIEFRLKRAADKSYRWHLARALPIPDAKGKIVRWYGSNTDIEELKSMSKRQGELQKISKSLKEQRDQLIELNRAKGEFIAVSSHQLRTPATGVKQYIGMTLEGYAGDVTPQQKTFLERAYQSNERQLTIINDLLRVAKVDSGRVTLRKEDTDLAELFNDIINEQSSRFAERGQNVDFRAEKVNLTVGIDRVKMRMVLENFIDNAIKYSPSSKTIEIMLSKANGKVHIAIKDEGVGIAKKDLHKVFDKFSRFGNTLLAEGSGLGLYWAKKIVSLHDGSIIVDSVQDKGSTFTIILPA